MVRITIKTENAAFADEPALEVARILRKLADSLEYGEPLVPATLRDLNGNTVGEMKVSKS